VVLEGMRALVTGGAMGLAPELVYTEELCAGGTVEEYRAFEDNYEPSRSTSR
jgi:hypothetical protein